MLVVLKRNYSELAHEAARLIAIAVRANPELRLGLAAGNTMRGPYQKLVRLHQEEGLDFSRVVTFNLDEYLGLKPGHPESFHSFMRKNLFSGVNLDQRNIHIPDGTITMDYQQYCANYEQSIRAAGGMDLQILGIGGNGHIGFNEPGSSLESRTHLQTLSEQTIEANHANFAAGEPMPKTAITMGIGTILDSKRILLLASGAGKAAAIAAAIDGPVTPAVPASALQLHPDATFLIDAEAASQLR